MKKITLLLSCLFATAVVTNAQETDYNHWSIEAGVNMSKAAQGFAGGYDNSVTGSIGGELGVRYMINEKFGFKFGALYSKLSEDDNVPAFETSYYRGTLEGVVNVGNILGFRDWTQRLNVLAHAGMGVGMISLGDGGISDEHDYTPAFIVGVTPQLRLSDKISLFADASFTAHSKQDFTWDGTSASNKNRDFDGGIATLTAGIQIYLGKNEKHADWVGSYAGSTTQEIDSIANRISDIENDMMDTDQDGVPDYLDREPNSMNGVTVDTKGVAVDKNNNGIPDEIEGSLDKRYAKSGQDGSSTSGLSIKDLISNGYVNVYFKFNSTQPETYSLEAVNYLVKYMNENSSANAELIGYADEIGNADYNLQLSEKRAKKVYDILIASGVSADRLEYKGEGIDDSVDKSSNEARQLVRRVTFKLK
ncbi:OmpA family protein [Mesonia sp. MT50]|uniref:OmpA family protein n=1 Tax=Mesonia profundi TaxID=3070998 RepID=A0ABU1A0V0_9FLAO|nr:OmpA family protein [Mesonia profundi]MDQ7917327.1 OmpA family protein [Mesonia profundi]